MDGNQLTSHFTQDFVSPHTDHWKELLAEFREVNDLCVLEVGSHEGRSALWWLQNILTGENSSLTCLDSWTWKEGAEERFDRVVLDSDKSSLVTKLKGFSRNTIPQLPDHHFDFIYIDGSHEARDVLLDALLCLPKAKPGGIILFDDYLWKGITETVHNLPQLGIDAFLQLCSDQIEMIHSGYQVAVRKKVAN